MWFYSFPQKGLPYPIFKNKNIKYDYTVINCCKIVTNYQVENL